MFTIIKGEGVLCLTYYHHIGSKYKHCCFNLAFMCLLNICAMYGAGKNLQICFMNETASDTESQASDVERNLNSNSKSSSRSSLFIKNNFNHPYQTRPLSVNITKHEKNTNTQSGKLLEIVLHGKILM